MLQKSAYRLRGTADAFFEAVRCRLLDSAGDLRSTLLTLAAVTQRTQGRLVVAGRSAWQACEGSERIPSPSFLSASPIRSAAALWGARCGRAATRPVSPSWSRQLPASGLNCSRRLHRGQASGARGRDDTHPKAFQDRRPSWYLSGLIRKPLREFGVILMHDVEHCFLGEVAMVLGN